MQADVLAGAEFEFEMSSLALRVHDVGHGGGSIERTARVLHEYDHLVRMLGTSYGLVRHGFASHYLDYFLRASASAGELDAFRKHWNAARKTARDAQPQTVLEQYFAGDRESLVLRSHTFREAIAMLDGGGLDGMRVGPLLSWAEYVAGLIGAIVDEEALRDYAHELWGSRPARSNRLIHIDGHPLSVKDILEYLGIVVELAYAVQYGDRREFPSDLSARTYLQILNTLKAFMPRALDAERMMMAQEVEGLFELALWIPLWPGMTAADLPEHAIDLIPSYRLSAVIDSCEELGLPLTLDTSVDDLDEVSTRVRVLQVAICEHRRWPLPDVIAQHWEAALQKVEAANETGWSRVFFHHPRSRRATWARQLVRECGEHPVSGAMLAGSRHYGTIGFPAILDLNHLELGYQHNQHVNWPEEDRHFQRLDTLLFTAAAYAPVPAHWNWLPASVREEALSTWARTPYAR
jgi:hypothetical protein